MTNAVIVPYGDDLNLFVRWPDAPLRWVAKFSSPSDIWWYLPGSRSHYTIVLAGGDIAPILAELANDYSDLIVIPARWFRHLPRSARRKRAAWALRLAINHTAAPLQHRRRNAAYGWFA